MRYGDLWTTRAATRTDLAFPGENHGRKIGQQTVILALANSHGIVQCFFYWWGIAPERRHNIWFET